MILDPNTIPMVEYMDSVALLLDPIVDGIFPVFQHGMHWKDWAASVVLLPGIANFQPPDPNGYDDWLEWANGFNQTVVVNVQ